MAFKTSDSIEQQEERKQARDNVDSSPTSTPPVREKLKQRDASRIAKWKWPKGFAPNPTGKNGRRDFAAELARAVIENNLQGLYQAYSKAALRGNAYLFKELSDRAYGRLKERIELDGSPYAATPIADLAQQLKQLEQKYEQQREELEALPPVSGEPKPN